MTIVLHVWIPGIPIGQPRRWEKQGRKGRWSYVPKDHPVHAWKALIMKMALDQTFRNIRWKSHVSYMEPLTGPISCNLRFWFPRPKTRPKRIPKALWDSGEAIWHDVKPDEDNLRKAVLDALSDVGLWKDDCQVCSGMTEKRYVSVLSEDAKAMGLKKYSGVHIEVETLR